MNIDIIFGKNNKLLVPIFVKQVIKVVDKQSAK